jgi:hypothetical protein
MSAMSEADIKSLEEKGREAVITAAHAIQQKCAYFHRAILLLHLLRDADDTYAPYMLISTVEYPTLYVIQKGDYGCRPGGPNDNSKHITATPRNQAMVCSWSKVADVFYAFRYAMPSGAVIESKRALLLADPLHVKLHLHPDIDVEHVRATAASIGVTFDCVDGDGASSSLHTASATTSGKTKSKSKSKKW